MVCFKPFKLYIVKYLGLKKKTQKTPNYNTAQRTGSSVSGVPDTVFFSICGKADLKMDAQCFCLHWLEYLCVHLYRMSVAAYRWCVHLTLEPHELAPHGSTLRRVFSVVNTTQPGSAVG